MNYIFLDILISGVLAFIMFGIGLSLKLSDFRKIFWYPKDLIVGLSLQMVLLPIFAFLLAGISPLSSELKVGIIILAICPGGTTSNFISYLIGANTALSISLTSFNSIISIISIPTIANFALHHYLGNNSVFSLPFTETLLQIVLIVIAPALMGIFVRNLFEQTAAKARYPVKIIATVLLLGVFIIKFFGQEDAGGAGLVWADLISIAPWVFTLNIGGLLIGYYTARLLNINRLNAMTTGLEVGLQNTALALLVAGTLIGNQIMTQPALVYALFSFWTSLSFAYFFKPLPDKP